MELYKKYILAVLVIVIISFLWIKNSAYKNEISNEYVSTEEIGNKEALTRSISSESSSVTSNDDNSIDADLKVRRQISINPIAFRETLSVLDIPTTAGVRDTEKESRELTILADLYPDDLLTQFLTAVSCTNKKFKFCNIRLYVDRIRALDPNNALADKFLFKHHLNNKDMVSALAVLENSNTDAYYDNYFADTTNEIYRQLTNEEWAPKLAPESWTSKSILAVGISGMKIPRPVITTTCVDQSKESLQKKQWLEACNRFGKVMSTSTNFLSRSLGLTIQRISQESDNQNSELQIVDEQEQKLKALMNEFGRLSDSGFFNRPQNVEIWLQDLKDYGEIIAAQRFIERYKKSN